MTADNPVDTAPVRIQAVPPLYPVRLRRMHVQGEALIDCVVTPDGRTANIRVVRATEPEFGASAAECVAQWRFKPAMRHGRPTYARLQIPIQFTLAE